MLFEIFQNQYQYDTSVLDKIQAKQNLFYFSFKAAIRFFQPHGGSRNKAMNLIMLDLLVNSCLFTHPAEQHYHSFGVLFLPTWQSNIHSPFSSVLGLYQPLREISGSLIAKSSTMLVAEHRWDNRWENSCLFAIRAGRVNQNRDAADQKTKTMSWKTL